MAFPVCRLVAAMQPNKWDKLHYFLGQEFESRYHRLCGLRNYDAEALINSGNRAIAHYQTVIALKPARLEVYESLWGMMFTMGRGEEALTILRQAVDVQHKLAKAHQLDKVGLRFLPAAPVSGNIGVLGMLDGYVKASILGQAGKVILLMPEHFNVSNRCFLDYWRPYITIVTDPLTTKSLAPLARYLEDPYHWSLTFKDQVWFISSGIQMVQKQWHAEKRAPLLTLSPADYQRGWKCLRALGVPQDAWFVCLHVRESGFKTGVRVDSRRYADVDAHRNADVDTYLLAVESIVARGGWVIRMGDPTMKPLPPMEQVIDYAHSDVRSDWMDVFCSAQCRFCMATSSGLPAVSIAFGVPLVQTNYLPLSTLILPEQDIFLPKLCRSVKNGRYLSFTDMLSPPLSTSLVRTGYELAGVEIVDNTPEEINDAVLEMLASLDGTLSYTKDDEQLQERFKSLTATCGTLIGQKDLGFNCRIGKDFLRKYASLLH